MATPASTPSASNGTYLYLNEHLGYWPEAVRHRLRVYDLSRGQLAPDVLFDRSEGKQGMTGDWHSQVISPDGRFLYSLFVNYSPYERRPDCLGTCDRSEQ